MTMSATSEKPGSGEPAAEGRGRREQARSVAWVILAIIITVFAVLNTGEVKVDWIVGSGRAPLIIVIAISLLIGIILTHFAHRRAAKRR
jgi:uncharacterized integral membrane protein